ncbi:MAG: hypothetical protein K2P94_08050 [Rhodospirillaceae bacterium]|nr:hypothetical protein [Rhodospirillaceae bacterium]
MKVIRVLIVVAADYTVLFGFIVSLQAWEVVMTLRTVLFSEKRRQNLYGLAGAIAVLVLAILPVTASAQSHGGGHGGRGGHGGGYSGGSFSGRGMDSSYGHSSAQAHGAVGAYGHTSSAGHGLAGSYRHGFIGSYGFRPYAPVFAGYGFYYDYAAAWPFLGLAAWELANYAYLTEAQVRAQENAIANATSGIINQPIIWNDGTTTGSVTPIREGQTPDGRLCREFEQKVTIDGRTQEARGTACQRADKSWQIVN